MCEVTNSYLGCQKPKGAGPKPKVAKLPKVAKKTSARTNPSEAAAFVTMPSESSDSDGSVEEVQRPQGQKKRRKRAAVAVSEDSASEGIFNYTFFYIF